MTLDIHKKTAVLIGLGTISSSYETGLRNSRGIDCRYVCDINPDAVAMKLYQDKEYVSDYLPLFRSGKVDMAIIATPPDTHAAIISDCLDNGVYPIVEKPVVPNRAVLSQMLHSESRFEVIFHWLHSSEVIWFAENIILKDVESISITIRDPYSDKDGVIRPEFYNKLGCWLDSGVNALSLLTRFVDLDSAVITSMSVAMDETSSQPYRACSRMKSGETRMEIDIRWDLEKDYKATFIKADGHEYLLDHTAQAVICDGVLIYRDDGMPRLSRHYFNFFTDYPLSSTDWDANLLIHRKLYEAYDNKIQGGMA